MVLNLQDLPVVCRDFGLTVERKVLQSFVELFDKVYLAKDGNLDCVDCEGEEALSTVQEDYTARVSLS